MLSYATHPKANNSSKIRPIETPPAHQRQTPALLPPRSRPISHPRSRKRLALQRQPPESEPRPSFLLQLLLRLSLVLVLKTVIFQDALELGTLMA